MNDGLFGLSATYVLVGRLNLRVDVPEDLGDAVVHLMRDVQALLRHCEAGDLLVQVGVVDGDPCLQREPL